MPRPKVRPEDRQRAPRACIPCKASKKRCDASEPCGHCIRRRAASSCHYIDSAYVKHLRKSSQSQRSVEQDQQQDSTPWPDTPTGGSAPGPTTTTTGGGGPPDSQTTNGDKVTRGRMLLNSKGERVYIGQYASLSFLQFLRHTIRKQMGPSVFTEDPRRKVMLEAKTMTDNSSPLSESPEQKRALVDLYFVATNGILDLFTRAEVEVYLGTSGASNSTGTGIDGHAAALDLIIAIGAQCRASDANDQKYATAMFTRARKASFAGGLEDPNVDMTRCFLLMTFFMLGACQRNSAFMYLGIASQASSALGLHVMEQYKHFNADERAIRLRTLKSLRVLDVMYCSILGRPYATGAVRPGRTAISTLNISAVNSRDFALNASFEVCSFVAQITPQLDTENSIDVHTAEDFLQKLQQWSSQLPVDMRTVRKSANEPLTLSEQETMAGNIQVSCVYYFAVMLVTRPFLVTSLMASMRNSTQATTVATPMAMIDDDIGDLAQACIDAAMLLANLCHEALQSNILLKQMCIMKAWIFAAGLVLGFSMFAQAETRLDMDESFGHAREVLRYLADNSPQADHYHDMLTSFADVIQQHRQHLRRGSKSKNKYVKQIVTFSATPDHASTGLHGSLQTQSSVDQANTAEDTSFPSVHDFDLNMSDFGPWPLESGGDFDFGMFGWDNFAAQISDNFSFDYDPAWSDIT